MTPLCPVRNVQYGGMVMQVYHGDCGSGLPKHDHDFEHMTMCCSGKIIVRKEGKEVILTKESSPVNLPAHQWHEIEIVEDSTVFVNVAKDSY